MLLFAVILATEQKRQNLAILEALLIQQHGLKINRQIDNFNNTLYIYIYIPTYIYTYTHLFSGYMAENEKIQERINMMRIQVHVKNIKSL